MGIPSPLPLLCLCSHDLHVSKVRFCLGIVAFALKHSLTSDPLRNTSTKHIPAPGLTRTPSVKIAEPSSPRLTRLALTVAKPLVSLRITRLFALCFINFAYSKNFIAQHSQHDMALSMEDVPGPLFPALCELSAKDTDFEESNPLKRSRPDSEAMTGFRGKGTGKTNGKGKGKGKGRWSQEYTWDMHQEARHRPTGSAPWAWKAAQGLDVEAVVYAMAKLCLRQETELSELRQEKSFLLHVNAGPHGILKPLIQASIKWNELRDQMKVDCSLKSELFRLMLKETAARMEKFERTPESIAAAEKAKWVATQPLTWLYQKWDPDARLLVLDPSRQGVSHQEVKTLLESMSEALKQDPAALNQFTPKRKLTETMSGASVAFKVTVGLRSSQCQILYDAFAKLAGMSVLQLIAANMHKKRQKHGRGGRGPQSDVALRLRLRNPSATNSCYVNSTFLILVHAWAQGGMPPGVLGALEALGTRLQAVLTTTRPVVLRDLPRGQAMMRLWAQPNRQHDIAEFFSHFVSFCRMPFEQECWQARDLRGPALHVLDEGTLQTPIPLHIPASRSDGQPCTFQECVKQFFRGQRCGCALASAAPLLCFQLKRYVFNVRTGVVRKLTTPIRFEEPSLQVPIWEDVSTLRTRHVRYQVSAIAFHEGRTPFAGHYRTCLLHQGCHYITDDNTGARLISPQMQHVVQSNSYLFLCTLQPSV